MGEIDLSLRRRHANSDSLKHAPRDFCPADVLWMHFLCTSFRSSCEPECKENIKYAGGSLGLKQASQVVVILVTVSARMFTIRKCCARESAQAKRCLLCTGVRSNAKGRESRQAINGTSSPQVVSSALFCDPKKAVQLGTMDYKPSGVRHGQLAEKKVTHMYTCR